MALTEGQGFRQTDAESGVWFAGAELLVHAFVQALPERGKPRQPLKRTRRLIAYGSAV